MQQFSTDNSPVEFELLSGHLLFADPLYFQDIINNHSQVDTSAIPDKRELVRVFEETFFPYGGGGLLGYKYVDKKSNTYLFDPTKLKKWHTDDEQQCEMVRFIGTVNLLNLARLCKNKRNAASTTLPSRPRC